MAAVRDAFDRRSSEWEVVYEGRAYHDHILRTRLHLVIAALGDAPRDGALLLDVGCGAGQLLTAAAQRGWTPIGCDVAPRQVRATRRRLEASGAQGIVVQAEGDRLPAPARVFRGVAATGYLEYLPDADAAVAELVRVAEHGATVVVTAPNRVRLSYLLDPIGVVRGRLFPNHRGYRRRYWTPRSFARLLQRAGLSEIAVSGHGVGRFTLAGVPLLSDERAARLDKWLLARAPAIVLRYAGANLVASGRVAP